MDEIKQEKNPADLLALFPAVTTLLTNYLADVEKAVAISPSNFNGIKDKLTKMVAIAEGAE